MRAARSMRQQRTAPSRRLHRTKAECATPRERSIHRFTGGIEASRSWARKVVPSASVPQLRSRGSASAGGIPVALASDLSAHCVDMDRVARAPQRQSLRCPDALHRDIVDLRRDRKALHAHLAEAGQHACRAACRDKRRVHARREQRRSMCPIATIRPIDAAAQKPTMSPSSSISHTNMALSSSCRWLEPIRISVEDRRQHERRSWSSLVFRKDLARHRLEQAGIRAVRGASRHFSIVGGAAL